MVNMKIPFLVLHLMVGLPFIQSCQNGATIKVGCVPETCRGGKWIPDANLIDSKCLKCHGYGDPHFESFSGAKFMWRYGCNYAMVQDGYSRKPSFGVFMRFRRTGIVSYIGSPTIYQENANTKVVLNPSNLFNVAVNGQNQAIDHNAPTLLRGPSSVPTSVYAWKHKDGSNIDCLRIYGKLQILVELCSKTISIWAPPENHYPVTLGGFCGRTDGVAQLIGRDGTIYNNPGNDTTDAPEAFGDSWEAHAQEPNCRTEERRIKRSLRQRRSIEIHSNCSYHSNIDGGDHHNKCLGVHDGPIGDDHLSACKYDLCIVDTDPGHTQAGFTQSWILSQHSEVHGRRKPHNDHTKEFAHGEECGIRNHEKFRSGPSGTNYESHYGEFPWMVALFSEGNNEYVAGASLVHPRIVLTAAHIVHRKRGFVARIGDWDLTHRTANELIADQTITVEKMVVHPQFSQYTLANNVALLILQSDAVLGETIIPICLPEPDQVFDGMECTVSGWGEREVETGDIGKVMKKVQVPIVKHSECQTMLRNTRLGSEFNLHDSFICAGGEGKDICQGHGGSPLICPQPNNPYKYVQIGVVAWGIGCGITGNPEVYGSVAKTVNWIHQVIEEEVGARA